MMEYWEQKYNDLLYDFKRLKQKYDDLQEKYDRTSDELCSANFKISNELEPRIQSEKRAYDRWVTDPEKGR